jgi:hypothetical protein
MIFAKSGQSFRARLDYASTLEDEGELPQLSEVPGIFVRQKNCYYLDEQRLEDLAMA